MYKTIRVYLLKNLSNNKIEIYNKYPNIIFSKDSYNLLGCDLSIQYYNQNPSILDIRRTMDKLELTISNYPSRLRLSARGYIVFAKEEYIPSFDQAYMLSETLKSIVKQLGYEENMANVVADSPSFNLESMLKYNYAEKKEKIKEILNKKGLKVHD
ncbi:hypothetical protein SAC12B_0014 [Lactobacillus phage SAC12B]|uniref:Uncharacterized protein n=1 Tax=Lactobacillus phage SAC12B TaxID=2510941 RepID=A0A4Y5FFA5_9CAUD|nr:hypothetical protein HWC10_gp014 [Lactobacillus phage SAC12B]QBJ03803.1 hypothetical protein SAC12B_0014 [Lactobacillus phage SAC12B]